MDNSIMGRLELIDEESAKRTIKYLRKTGIGGYKYREEGVEYHKFNGDKFMIELKEKPFILKTLEYNNFFGNANESYIDILSITEDGVTFYASGAKFGDGIIFVPMSNITCIHTIIREQINRHICSEFKL